MYADVKTKKGLIFTIGLLCAALTFAFVMFYQKNFRVTTEYLVISNTQTQDTQAYYTALRSTEVISKILSGVMYSEIFIDEIERMGGFVDAPLSENKKKRLKQWGRTIAVGHNADYASLYVSVRDNDIAQARSIDAAVHKLLTTRASEFYGGSNVVKIQRISGPIIEPNPPLITILLTIVMGFVAGIFLALMGLYYSRILGFSGNRKAAERHIVK